MQIGPPINGSSAATVTWTDQNYQPRGNYQANLGYTPVHQGGGAYQGANAIYIGWDGGGLRAQVDGTDLGRIWTEVNTPFSGQPVRDGRLVYAGDP